MVKAAVMAGAGNRGIHKRKEADSDGDYGLPPTHPVFLIAVIGLILIAVLGILAIVCKFLPKKWTCFGKRSKNDDVELQLGRRSRSPNIRRNSSSGSHSQSNTHTRSHNSGNGNGSHLNKGANDRKSSNHNGSHQQEFHHLSPTVNENDKKMKHSSGEREERKLLSVPKEPDIQIVAREGREGRKKSDDRDRSSNTKDKCKKSKEGHVQLIITPKDGKENILS